MLSTRAEHIVDWYRRATAEDLAEGLDWYDRAAQLAEALAAGTPFTREQTAGVVAALSPRVSWPVNVAGATAMVRAAAQGSRQPTVAGFQANRDKAWRILMRDDLDPLDTLGGPKVTAFYASILGNRDRPVIDVWAARAADPGQPNRSLTPHQYDEYADAYREAAQLLGTDPRTVQAAVWVAIRKHTLATMPHQAWLLDRKDFD